MLAYILHILTTVLNVANLLYFKEFKNVQTNLYKNFIAQNKISFKYILQVTTKLELKKFCHLPTTFSYMDIFITAKFLKVTSHRLH